MVGIQKRFGRLSWRRMGGGHKLFDFRRRTARRVELGQFAYSQSRPGFREAHRLERRKIRYRFFAIRWGSYKSAGWQRAGIQFPARPTTITSVGTLIGFAFAVANTSAQRARAKRGPAKKQRGRALSKLRPH